LSLNFPQPLSPTLHESSNFKLTGETAKAEDKPKQVSAGQFGVPLGFFETPFSSPVARAAARPSSSSVPTLLKTGKIGGQLRGLGGSIIDGEKTMKNFHLQMATLDNKRVFKAVGPPRKIAAKRVKTLPSREQEALAPTYSHRKQKLKSCFTPKATMAVIVQKDLAPVPKVSRHTIVCTHIHRMVKNPYGPATLLPMKTYTTYY